MTPATPDGTVPKCSKRFAVKAAQESSGIFGPVDNFRLCAGPAGLIEIAAQTWRAKNPANRHRRVIWL
jgi:hypothetical protein